MNEVPNYAHSVHHPPSMPMLDAQESTVSYLTVIYPPLHRQTHTLSLFKTPFLTWGKSKGKGGRPARGRVPGRTCRRSNYCGFAEVLGLSRAEFSGLNIGIGEHKMTAR